MKVSKLKEFTYILFNDGLVGTARDFLKFIKSNKKESALCSIAGYLINEGRILSQICSSLQISPLELIENFNIKMYLYSFIHPVFVYKGSSTALIHPLYCHFLEGSSYALLALEILYLIKGKEGLVNLLREITHYKK